MNSSDYNVSNSIPCPVKEDFIFYEIYNAVSGEMIENVPYLEYHSDKSRYAKYKCKEVFDEEAFQNQWNKWVANEDRLIHEFKEKLFEDHQVENNPKREKCFQLAWEYGSSSGFERVKYYFDDLVELI